MVSGANMSIAHPRAHARSITLGSVGSASRAATLARLLDSRFRIPGTKIRFGVDALLGLVPVVGDSISLVLSCLIVLEAVSRGVSRGVLMRMLANVGVDWLIGLVPLVGDVFDVWFKANLRNLVLLERELARRR
jgi:hypothetical protein